MDSMYELRGASTALQKLASEQNDGENRQLSNATKPTDWQRGVDIVSMEQPPTWRLINVPTGDGPGEDGRSIEEKIYTVQGIVCGIALPPLMEKPIVQPARYKFVRQGISITGAGTSTFNEAVMAVQEIYTLFHCQFPDGKLNSWTAATHAGHQALNISNRYLTPKRDAPGIEHIPFGEGVDPHGILEDMAKSGYVHSEENKVLHYICHVNEKGDRSFEDAKPQIFRIGDIVEVQMSFVCVPLKEQNFKLLSVLRSIALIDSTFTQDALRKRMTIPNEPGKPILKRKVGYSNTIWEAKRPNHENMDTEE